MMEKITDRLFWTLSAIIIAALCMTIGIKTFPKTTAMMLGYSLNRGDITQNGFGTGSIKTPYWLKPSTASAPLIVEDDSPQVRDLKNQVAKLQSDAKNKDDAIQKLQKQISDANNKLNALTASLNQATSDAINKNIDASNQITSYQTSITNLTNQMNSQIQQAQTNATNYNNQITALINQESNLQKQLKNLQDGAGVSSGATSDQQAQITNLTTQIQQVQDQINSTNQSIMDSNQQLVTQLNTISAQVNDATNQHQNNLYNLNAIQQLSSQLYQDYYSAFPQLWDNLTIDQQNDFIKNGFDNLAQGIKDLWAPKHFRSLSQDQQLAYANTGYSMLSQVDQDYVDQLRATDVSDSGLQGIDNGDGTATITNYTSDVGANLVIPDYVKINNVTLKVTRIGPSALQAAPIKTLVLPNTVTSIGNYAFYGTSFTSGYGLTNVTLSNKLTTIGSYAFANNATLTTINGFPSTLTSIGGRAFANTSLSSISLPRGVSVDVNSAFYGVNPLVVNAITYF